MNNIDLNNTYWDRLNGYVTELRVDARWVLRNKDNDKPYGSLRIVSHPDLKPGYLRAYFTYVTSIKNKTAEEKMRTVEDYQIDFTDLEVFSISDNVKTEQDKFEAPINVLQDKFGVKVFG